MQNPFPIHEVHTPVSSPHFCHCALSRHLLLTLLLSVSRRLRRGIIFGLRRIFFNRPGFLRKPFMATCIAPPRVLPAGLPLKIRNAPLWHTQLRKGRHASLASAPHLTQSLTLRWRSREGVNKFRSIKKQTSVYYTLLERFHCMTFYTRFCCTTLS